MLDRHAKGILYADRHLWCKVRAAVKQSRERRPGRTEHLCGIRHRLALCLDYLAFDEPTRTAGLYRRTVARI